MRYPYSKINRAGLFFPGVSLLILLVILGLSGPVAAAEPEGSSSQNQVENISLAGQGAQATVDIVTREPVGYRYTVYDSFDPVRVVIDFPGMDVAGVAKSIAGNGDPVQEVRVSSFDLTSGKLGRIELLLSAATKYNVDLEGNQFKISFDHGTGTAAVGQAAPAQPAVASPEPASAPVAEKPAMAVAAPETDVAAKAEVETAAPAAASGAELQILGSKAVVTSDQPVEKYQYFRLGSPPRLVLDLYGVKPGFRERVFPAEDGFKQVRVGVYPDKTRLVFDGSARRLPEFTVAQDGPKITVDWTALAGQKPAAKKAPATAAAAPQQAGTNEVNVEGVDFQVENGESVLSVALSAPGQLIQPEAKGKTVGFGVRNATIERPLRRVLDTSAFPTPIRQVTPYTVAVGESQDVRFAVEMKTMADYSLEEKGSVVLFKVKNPEVPAPVRDEVKAVPVPAQAAAAPTATPAPASASQMAAEAPAPAETAAAPSPVVPTTGPIGAEANKLYTGQKISLVFDNADIRNILQLIAEVSNLNIIASDDVKGTITLRLIDVPWDQALDLIMEIKGLGIIRDGNVARILPKEQIRAMEEAKLTANRTKEKLEDLVTEVISVNYTGLENVAKPSRELLTDRGKITEDSRNKQIIVTDVPSVIEKVKKLVAILDTPERQVMIEARIVEANATFSRDLGIKWGFSSEGENRTAQLGNNQFDLGFGGSFLIPPPTSGNVIGGAGLGAGLSFGKVGSTTLDLKISALEAAGEGKVISTPRVSTLNGGQAKISQGTKIPYQSTGPDGTKTEFVDANLELTVTPVINPDNSIILDINATNSSMGADVNTGIQSTAPAIDTKEAKTKLLVRDGETTVMGGIFVETGSSSEAGVPWLRTLPWIGHLFKSTSKSKTRSELLIFITPRIIE